MIKKWNHFTFSHPWCDVKLSNWFSVYELIQYRKKIICLPQILVSPFPLYLIYLILIYSYNRIIYKNLLLSHNIKKFQIYNFQIFKFSKFINLKTKNLKNLNS